MLRSARLFVQLQSAPEPSEPMNSSQQDALRSQTMTVLIGASVMLTISMGMRQAFGLFITPVTQDIAVTVTDFAFALAVQNIVWGATQPFTGAVADKFGCRAITVFGSVL